MPIHQPITKRFNIKGNNRRIKNLLLSGFLIQLWSCGCFWAYVNSFQGGTTLGKASQRLVGLCKLGIVFSPCQRMISFAWRDRLI